MTTVLAGPPVDGGMSAEETRELDSGEVRAQRT